MPGTVSIGGMGKSDILRAARERNVHLNTAAEVLFEDRRFTTLDRQHITGIVALSVAELGFGGGATYGQIAERALESGFFECPLELGPHLRLQFLDQPDAAMPLTHGRAPPGSLTIASGPLDDADETAKGFYLSHVEGVLWLRGYWSWAGHVWSPEDVLVFGRLQ